jgi:uncharacterized protein (TIGR03067 family)
MDDKDLALLQGRWLQIGYERDGIENLCDEEDGWQPLTIIAGNSFTVVISDGSTVLTGEFSIESNQKPKAIDWTDRAGSYASDHKILAIYELNATHFVFCAAYDGAPRPVEFKTNVGQVLRRMRRV